MVADVIVPCVIAALRLVIDSLDIILKFWNDGSVGRSHGSYLSSNGERYRNRIGRSQKPTIVVAIVGGSFAGLTALRQVVSKHRQRQSDQSLHIVLLDQNEYFEYTPGLLRLFCDMNSFDNVYGRLPSQLPTSSSSVDGGDEISYKFIQGQVVALNASSSLALSAAANSADSAAGSTGATKKILIYKPTTPSQAGEKEKAPISDNNSTGSGPRRRQIFPTTVTTTAKTTATDDIRVLEYDYLILATGCTHSYPISPMMSSTLPQCGERTLQQRHESWMKTNANLNQATKVLILGGGAVGVELAAEIVDHYNTRTSRNKKVTILQGSSTLVPNFPSYVGRYALQWLHSRKVNVLFNARIQSWTPTSCTLQNGRIIYADIVYCCFGSSPNSESIYSNETETAKKNRYVPTNDCLQIISDVHHSSTMNGGSVRQRLDDGYHFACGDVCHPPTENDKQAFHAEVQGKIVGQNVMRMIQGKASPSATASGTLLRYPYDVTESDQMPLIFVLSLGRYDGVLGFNNLLVPGVVAAIIKWILEYTQLLHIMNASPVSSFIWNHVAENVSFFLNKTVLKPTRRTSNKRE